jgi:hypothetical protein
LYELFARRCRDDFAVVALAFRRASWRRANARLEASATKTASRDTAPLCRYRHQKKAASRIFRDAAFRPALFAFVE